MATRVAEKGSAAAFLTPLHSWVLGKVESYDAKSNTYLCSASDPEPMNIKVKAVAEEFFAARVEYLEEDVNDLLMLTELHEASLLFCLKRRYMRDIVYTNIGPIVVALNPFTFEIPWYKDERMRDYLSEGVVIERNLPHTWAVAHNTYWEMKENRQNQTVLISGESGAGKTEAAKIVVKYVGILSTMHGTHAQQDACAVVNRKVIAASPILEAFGNAKTVRNDNSSRFGKFMKLQFDGEGFLIGSHATKYLLEKSRIITASKDERVYHAFYQLAGGQENKKYSIRGVAVCKSLKTGDCTSIPGVDEAAAFAECKQAFADVGITEDEQNGVWRICAGILFFQNVEFIEKDERNNVIAEVDKDWTTALERACEMWGVSRVDMERELLTSSISQRGDAAVVKFNDRAKAYDTRDSVSRNLYGWLFDWIVTRINATTDASSRCLQWIGLLDIFGFEDFEINSFEQLCINLANETLQNHYNFFIFTEDVRECQEEGIDTTSVTFTDNKGCIDLLAATKNSIFSILDDECKVGSGTDGGFQAKVVREFQGTKASPGNPFFVALHGKWQDSAFRIRHYAGDVTYQIAGFLEKNKDTLKEAMKEVLSRTSVAFIAPLVPPADDPSRPQVRLTVSSSFNRQLQELMNVINQTNPHWIRCVKPHVAKKPRHFSHQSVMQQLRSAGVLATVQIRQGGYPIRFKKPLFLQRYRILIQEGDGNTDAQICAAVFRRLCIAPEVGQLGKTKVFLRQKAFLALNHAKDDATVVLAAIFQKMGKGMQERAALFKAYCRKNKERLLAELKAREEAARRQREEAERRRRAEEDERRRREEAERQRLLRVTLILQRYARGKLARLAFARHFLEVLRAREEREADLRYAKGRQHLEKSAASLKQLERREAERRQAMDSKNKGAAQRDNGFDDPTDGVRLNAYEQMLKRREALRLRRDQRIAQIDERERARDEAAERKAKAMRDRARATAAESLKVKEAAEAKLRVERRKEMTARADAEEQRIAAAAQRRALAVQKAEERRREVEEAQMRVMIAESTSTTNAAAAGGGGAAVDSPWDGAVLDRSSFIAAKEDWVAQQQWAAVRSQYLDRARDREARFLRNFDSKLTLQERGIVTAPSGFASPQRDQMWAEARSLDGATGLPTMLTAKQLRLELEFRRRQQEVALENAHGFA